LDLLRQWREDSVRRSDDVVDIWEEILSADATQLGDERYMIVEQVAVAAMDTHRTDVVDRCLAELKNAFDVDSFRIRRLYGMRYEMLERWDKALAIYDEILKDDEANSSARKRKIAILKAQGENTRAIAELNKYLKE
jgi:tetratricopeptide (TPR) repeat protein